MKPVVSKTLEIARRELGTREKGENHGPRVDEYQKADTLPGTGYAWCASFVAWVLAQVALALLIKIVWSNSASCDVILADAKARGLLRSAPHPGDVVIVRAKKRDGSYSKTDGIHTGIVEVVHDNGDFVSIEGNTNADGGREGHSVLRQTRKNNGRYYFIRWADTIPDATPRPEAKPYDVVLFLSGRRIIVPSIMQNGSVLVAARDWADARGQKIAWNADSQAVEIAGEEVPFQPRFISGRAYFGLRDLAEWVGAPLRIDVSMRRVEVAG